MTALPEARIAAHAAGFERRTLEVKRPAVSRAKLESPRLNPCPAEAKLFSPARLTSFARVNTIAATVSKHVLALAGGRVDHVAKAS